MKRVALSKVKDHLSEYLDLAEKEEGIITRHGKPAALSPHLRISLSCFLISDQPFTITVILRNVKNQNPTQLLFP